MCLFTHIYIYIYIYIYINDQYTIMKYAIKEYTIITYTIITYTIIKYTIIRYTNNQSHFEKPGVPKGLAARGARGQPFLQRRPKAAASMFCFMTLFIRVYLIVVCFLWCILLLYIELLCKANMVFFYLPP